MYKANMICICMTIATGLTTYGLKQRVIASEDQLKSMKAQIRHYEQSIHLLQAEWSFLNDPERLQNLIEANATLVPGQGIHLAMEEQFDAQLGLDQANHQSQPIATS